ncbi:MAG: hypothetical protein AABO58_13295, partial [Acidobacteriota bacterium]
VFSLLCVLLFFFVLFFFFFVVFFFWGGLGFISRTTTALMFWGLGFLRGERGACVWCAGVHPAGRGLDGRRSTATSPREWQDTLGALVIGREPAGELAASLRADPALAVFRKLVWQVRAGMIVDNLTYTCRLLILTRGEDFLRALFDDYCAAAAPELFGSAEAEAFAGYLSSRRLDEPFLDDMLAFERAAIQVNLDGERRVINTRHDPNLLMAALNEGRVPAALEEEDLEVVVG